MNSSFSTFSSSKYFTRKSFAILSDVDDDSMLEQADQQLPAIINTKVKSVYHQRCTVPNKDFNILHNAIGSKLQTTVTIQHQPSHNHSSSSYPSTEFFNRVSTKLRNLRAPAPASVEDSETETDSDRNRKRVMAEKPMFITTVRSGAFLEPPPEVAALLGLRKNYSTTLTSTTSSSEKSGNEHSVMYSFASRPRVMKAPSPRDSIRRRKRDLEDDTAKATKDERPTFYGNTMYDRRVARGSNFASLRPTAASTEHAQSRQAEARRRAAVRQRAQIRARRLRMGTPPPVDGRRHEQMQTEKHWEEITEKTPEKSIACQADLPTDSTSHSTRSLANSTVSVEDAATQINPGDLPTCDDQSQTVIVTYIVNKILREAILEINEEIENFRSFSCSEKMTRHRKITSEEEFFGDSAIIIAREELLGLIQGAIQYLKSLDEPDPSLERVEKMEREKLLRTTIREIRTIVRDIRFISEIVQKQIQNLVFNEHEEPNSGSEGEIVNEERTAEPGSSVRLDDVISTEMNQDEALDSQETEAVIADTDKTDLSSTVQMDDDGLVEGGTEIKEDTTVHVNEKTEVGATKEFANEQEIEVTKNENLEREEILTSQLESDDEIAPVDTSEEGSPAKRKKREASLSPEYDEGGNQTRTLSETESKEILESKDSAGELDSKPLPQSVDGVPNSSTVQTANAQLQEGNAPPEGDTEGSESENPPPPAEQLADTKVSSNEGVSKDDSIHLDEEEGEQNRKEADVEGDTDASKEVTTIPDSPADEGDSADPHNQNSTEGNQSVAKEGSTKLEDETQPDETESVSDEISTKNEGEGPSNVSLNHSEEDSEIVVEKEDAAAQRVNTTSSGNDENLPAEIRKEGDGTIPEESTDTVDTEHDENVEVLALEKSEKGDSSTLKTITTKNEEELSPGNENEPLGEPINLNQSRKKIGKTVSLKRDSIDATESTDNTSLKRRSSSLPNPNFDDAEDTEKKGVGENEGEKYTGETTTTLQDENMSDDKSLEDTPPVEDQPMENSARVSLTDSAIALESQILPEEETMEKSTAEEGEESENTEVSTEEASSPDAPSAERRLTVISKTENAVQSSALKKSTSIDETEKKSTKLLRREGTVSDEVVQNDSLENEQILDAEETTASFTTTPNEETAKDLDAEVTASDENVIREKSDSVDGIADSPSNDETIRDEQVAAKRDSVAAEEKTKQQSTNTDLDAEDDSDDIEIEGTRIVEETFTETTKTYKEISIRETTLVEREFIEYTTADDDLENSANSAASSKKSSRESTASDSTKQEVFINIERPSSDKNLSGRNPKLSTNGKANSNGSQNRNGTVLMRKS